MRGASWEGWRDIDGDGEGGSDLDGDSCWIATLDSYTG